MKGEPAGTSEQRPSGHRRWLTWLASMLGGALFLWLASGYLELWPSRMVIASPASLLGAIALQVPYAILRAMRLQFVLDPLVRRATADPRARFDRRALYGSGFVSFWVLLALPLKLGELSRPLLVARPELPGVGVPEAVGAVAVERLVDALIISGMLFAGLGLGAADLEAQVVDIRGIGLGMLGIFFAGVGVLLWSARDPKRTGAVAWRVGALFSEGVGEFAARVSTRVAFTMQQVLVPRQGGRLVAWSVAYWCITTLQMWLMMRGAGIALGMFEAMAVVAILGLSIQLPGGPAQAGTFQVGMLLALSLFLPQARIAAEGSTFAALMYLLQFFGAAIVALPGLWLMAAVRRAAPDAPDPPPAVP